MITEKRIDFEFDAPARKPSALDDIARMVSSARRDINAIERIRATYGLDEHIIDAAGVVGHIEEDTLSRVESVARCENKRHNGNGKIEF